MADLKVPERCSLCGEPFEEGDRIRFTRRATLVKGYRSWRGPDGNVVHERPLQPRVESQPIRDVTHFACRGERLGG